MSSSLSYNINIQEFFDNPSEKFFPKEHIEFYHSLPYYYEDENHFFCHAGINPNRGLDKQDKEDLIWIRGEWISSDYEGKTVVFGHTPLDYAFVGKHKIGLDTGAVYGNLLTCLELKTKKIYYVKTNSTLY